MWKIICLTLILSVLLVDQCVAGPVLVGRSEGMNNQVEEVVSGLEVPWKKAFLSPSEQIFAEREGQLTILHPDFDHRTLFPAKPLPVGEEIFRDFSAATS